MPEADSASLSSFIIASTNWFVGSESTSPFEVAPSTCSSDVLSFRSDALVETCSSIEVVSCPFCD
jgi:hypothetical protein